MGFKILRDFNMAMLAKQIWRLHIQPNSLLAKCYKAKYYPHNDVLNAPVHKNPSYAWRSLYQAKWIINKGSCWKIGNGHKVRFQEDNWLPFQNGFKVITPHSNPNTPAMVHDLLETNPFDWNYQILQTNFLPIDSGQIVQLPIIH